MSKTEIIAELAQLSREDLADVKAWLDRRALEKSALGADSTQAAQIRSPRLADPVQSADFTKHVSELPRNAGREG